MIRWARPITGFMGTSRQECSAPLRIWTHAAQQMVDGFTAPAGEFGAAFARGIASYWIGVKMGEDLGRPVPPLSPQVLAEQVDTSRTATSG
jgi:hypothetical protein